MGQVPTAPRSYPSETQCPSMLPAHRARAAYSYRPKIAHTNVGNPIGTDAVLHGSIARCQPFPISPCVPNQFDVSRDKSSVFFDARSDPRDGRCRTRSGSKFFISSHDDLHRFPGLQRQCDCAGFKTRINFSAKTTADFGAYYPKLTFGDVKGFRQNRAQEKNLLRAAPHRHGTRLAHRNRRVRFYITMVNLAGAKRIVENKIRALESHLNIASFMDRSVNNVGPRCRIPRGQVDVTTGIVRHVFVN